MNEIEKKKADLSAMPDRVGELRVMPSGPKDPDSATLVRFTLTGAVRALRTTVRLNPKVGHTYHIGGQNNKKILISASGYEYLNHALGVTFHIPERIYGEDGKLHANPHVERDSRGDIERIRIRCIGGFRNAAGNYVLHDSTLLYDLRPMLAQDIMKKWRPWDSEPKKWGTIYSEGNVPPEVAKDPKRKCVVMTGGDVLAVKLDSAEVLDMIAEHANRVRFATRNAETIVKRNIYKRAFARAELDPSDLSVTVTAWPHVDMKVTTDVGYLLAHPDKNTETFRSEETVDTADSEQESMGGESLGEEPPPIDDDQEPSSPTPGEVAAPAEREESSTGHRGEQPPSDGSFSQPEPTETNQPEPERTDEYDSELGF